MSQPSSGVLTDMSTIIGGNHIHSLLLARKALIAARQASSGAPPAIANVRNSLVWRQSAPAGTLPPNVFRNFPSLATALEQVQGQKLVQIDPRFAPCTVPPGSYPLSQLGDVKFMGAGPLSPIGALPILTFADGATFPNVAGSGNCIGGFQDLNLVYSGVGPVPIPLGATAWLIDFQNCTVNCTGTTTPLIQSTGTTVGLLTLRDLSFFTGGGRIFDAQGTSAVQIRNTDASIIGPNCLTSAVGTLIQIYYGAGAGTSSRVHAGLLGTLLMTGNGQLAQVPINRLSTRQIANAGVAPAIGAVLFANQTLTAQTTGNYRLIWTVEASNAAAGDQTLSILASAFGGVLASVFDQTITVPANTDKVVYGGEVVFDGQTGFARLAADASLRTTVNAAITAGAGNFTTVLNHGSLRIEECG